jgi:hypothetical protein
MFIITLITIANTKPSMMIMDGMNPLRISGVKCIKKAMTKHTLHSSATREKNKSFGMVEG